MRFKKIKSIHDGGTLHQKGLLAPPSGGTISGRSRARSLMLFFMMFIQVAQAQVTSFTVSTIQTGSTKINTVTSLKITGSIGGTIEANDCLKVKYSQPYSLSKTYWTTAGNAASDFYRPFQTGASVTATSSPAVTVQTPTSDGTEVCLKMNAAGTSTTTAFDYDVSAIFLTPFTKRPNTYLQVYYCKGGADCTDTSTNAVAATCNTGAILMTSKVCRQTTPFTFTTDSQTAHGTPTISSTATIVGQSDQTAQFSIPVSSNEVTQWPGKLEITLPTWYGEAGEYVLQHTSTCTSSELSGLQSSLVIRGTEGILQLTYSKLTKPASNNPLRITCTNYRNPVYSKAVTGFSINLLDRESFSQQAFQYPTFQMDKKTLTANSALAASNVDVFFYPQGTSTVKNPIEVQSKADIKIRFVMPIPVENTQCYLRLVFPTEFNLPRTELTYQGSVSGVFMTSSYGIDLNVNSDVYIAKQQTDRTIVFKGCNFAGNGKIAEIKIAGITTINSVRSTGAFQIAMFKEFDVSTEVLSNPILTAQKSLTASYFTSGPLSGGVFTAALSYIQLPTTYQVDFILTNALVKKEASKGGALYVIFPSIMPHKNSPTILSLDGSIQGAAITRDTTFKKTGEFDCATSTQACYRITYTNTADIAGGTKIQLRITGPENAVSVQTAGKFYAQTVLYEGSQEYEVNYQGWESSFKSEKGGISPQTNQNIGMSDLTTYNAPTTATIYYTLDNRVPAQGYIEIGLPSSMIFSSTPDVQSSSGGSINFRSTFQSNQTGAKSKTTVEVAAGSYQLRVTGLRNPRSMEPTQAFILNTYDKDGNLIGNGTGGNVQMTKAGSFTRMNLYATNKTNGALANYTVSWIADIPQTTGDSLHLKFPVSMNTPVEPVCKPIKCIKEVSCSAEKGTIIAVLSVIEQSCLNKVGSNFTIVVWNIKNSPTMLPSVPVTADVYTSKYLLVSSYSGNLQITNTDPGNLLRSNINLESSSVTINGQATIAKGYGAVNEYQVRFVPTNAIPRLAWVVIELPDDVSVANNDKNSFEQYCQAQTSNTFIGSDYCKLLLLGNNKKVIMFQNIFQEQDSFSAQTTLLFNLTNPPTNFRLNTTKMSAHDKWSYDRTKTFFIRTVTFNLDQINGYQIVKTSGYQQTEVKKLLAELNRKSYSQLNQTYFVGIDQYPWNDIYPPMKCNPPCKTCSDSNPNDCISCWGNGTNTGGQGQVVNYFLQDSLKYDGSKTCYSSCYNGFTTNGQGVFVRDNTAQKNIDWAKSYFVCERCDVSCNTCKGQGLRNKTTGLIDIGVAGDKFRCTTCSAALGFQFFIAKELKCVSQCSTGYYQKDIAGNFECGVCQWPCKTCRKCYTEATTTADGRKRNKDEYCDKPKTNPLDGDPSSTFCTSCNQGAFYPFHVEDVESIQDYIRGSRGMVDNKSYALTQDNSNKIKSSFGKIRMDEFLAKKMGGTIDTSLGLANPGSSIISVQKSTTYKEFYEAQYKQFKFPLRNLHSARCLDKCPDGFASVDGICLKCKAPCKTCRGSTTKCTGCHKDGANPYIYGRVCYKKCPDQTATDEKNKKCIGCTNGCKRCKHDDPNFCLECTSPLLIYDNGKNSTCTRICPTKFVPNFFGTKCIPEGQLPIIWFPFILMTILAFAICWATQYSSKNTQQQHKVFLSFFAISGVIHFVGIWAQLILTFFQGQIAMILVPIIALGVQYLLNSVYNIMWETFAPPCVLDSEEHGSLTQRECEAMKDADQWFLKWAEKYDDTASRIKFFVRWVSYKMFFLPFTHFMGYPRFTLRSQDYEIIWEWSQDQCEKYQNGGNLLNPSKLLPAEFFDAQSKYRFPGQIAQKRDYNSPIAKFLTIQGKHKVIRQKFIIEWFNQQVETDKESSLKFEDLPEKDQKEYLDKVWEYAQGIGLQEIPFQDGQENQAKKINDVETSPYNYLQHSYLTPTREFLMVPDTRIKDKFSEYLKYDALGVMALIAIGDLICLGAYLIQYPINQLLVECIEMPILSLLQIYMMFYLKQHWEEQRLPLNMKDSKFNYLFKNKMIHDFDDPQDIVGGPPKFDIWEQNAKLYDFIKVFQQNKLEELLEVFGRRQCKSCIEFNTGTEKVEDDRKIKSWPLSPQAEKDYAGRAGEFNLIDFQLQNNVYADTAEPTAMFESVARDFSEFGAQVFAFDIQEALNRKGGNLVTPGLDDDRRKSNTNKKRRGRKNKYHKLIDQEDDQEANQMTEEDDADGLDKVDEEDDDDEEELIRLKKEEEARKRDEENARIAAEKKRKEEEDAKRRKQMEKEREEREKREEEDRILREQAEQERRAAEKARIEAELARKQDDDLEKDILVNHSPEKRAVPGDIDQESNYSGIQMKGNAIDNFKAQQQQDILEVPPKFESRRFNECDIIGDYDRDEKGNVLAGEPDPSTDKFKDKSGNETNNRGYLVDPNSQDIIDNLNGEKMFSKDDMDERGEVPAPFCIEKHNFNPHLVRGHFDYDRNDKAIVDKGTGGTIMGRSPEKKTPKIHGSPSKAPEFKDKRGSKVSSRGYRVDEEGHMLDNHGRKKFDRAHMTDDGDLPKLFNYNGRRYDITDCIGQLDKDEFGYYVFETDKNGRRVDKLGRPVNSRGYLIDDQGNVIDKDGKQLFEYKHLYDDEIPKIFPFTKFNIKNILGDFEMDPIGNPILDRDQEGNLIERQGRKVNIKGYLIDKHGNIIDKRGKIMFEKKLLDSEQDIPKVFRTGLLKSDTASSLSRLMDEIGRNQPSEMGDDGPGDNRPRSGATSVDSAMDETPYKYYQENKGIADMEDEEEYDDEEDDHPGGRKAQEDGGPDMAKVRRKKKKKKKKRKKRPEEIEDPSLREHLMAGAYGGIAKPKIKRPGVKYTTDIDSGIRDLAMQPMMSGLGRDSSNQNIDKASLVDAVISKNVKNFVKNMVPSEIGSAAGKKRVMEATSKLLDPQQREAMLKQQEMEKIRKKKVAQVRRLRQKGMLGENDKDVDFEKMFGKDIDEFLEDSEWDIESIDKMSHFSKGSKATIRSSAAVSSRLKGMEKVYLQNTTQSGLKLNAQGMPVKKGTGKRGQKFRGSGQKGDSDIESVNSRGVPKPPRKKAWDTGSRRSSQKRI